MGAEGRDEGGAGGAGSLRGLRAVGGSTGGRRLPEVSPYGLSPLSPKERVRTDRADVRRVSGGRRCGVRATLSPGEAERIVQAVCTRMKHRLAGSLSEWEDLLVVGRAAVLAAERSFDPSRGAKPGTHVWNTVCWAVEDELQVMSPWGRGGAEAGRKYYKRYGKRAPWEGSICSLDVPATTGDGEGERLSDLVPDPEVDVQADTLAREEFSRVAAAMAVLPALERKLLRLRYCQGASYEACAVAIGVSRNTARKYEKVALEWLRLRLEGEMGSATAADKSARLASGGEQ